MELHNINPGERTSWYDKHVEDWHEEQRKEEKNLSLKISFAVPGQVMGL